MHRSPSAWRECRGERRLQDNINASALVALARTLGVSVDALLVPYRHGEGKQMELVRELAVEYHELASLPEEQQRLVAAILWACVGELAKRESD